MLDFGASVLERRPESEVRPVVAVEVAAREGVAEFVARLRRFLHPRRVLAKDPVAVARETMLGAVDHLDGAGKRLTADRLALDAHREVATAVAVEVTADVGRLRAGRGQRKDHDHP